MAVFYLEKLRASKRPFEAQGGSGGKKLKKKFERRTVVGEAVGRKRRPNAEAYGKNTKLIIGKNAVKINN